MHSPTAPRNTTVAETPTMMVVDDHAILLRMLTKTLRQICRLRIRGFESPTELLNEFRLQPDQTRIVLTDYNMPQMEGTDLCNRLHDISPDLPVVLMSANPAAQDRLADAQFAGFLCKPFELKDLAAIIKCLTTNAAR